MTSEYIAPADFLLGIDFGGTKIEIAALSHTGDFLLRRRARNPGNYVAAIELVCELVRGAELELGGHGRVGIGLPGSPSPRTGLMRNANSRFLNGRHFQKDLSAALGRTVRIANDANCFSLSEAVDGAGAGAGVVFGVILGTGCGGGLVVHGELIEGASGIGAELGHNPLPWPRADELTGPECWCGQHNCIESWVSGTGMARAFQAETGRLLRSEEIIYAMRGGDAEAATAFNHYVDRLARVLAHVANIVDPDIFVLGGGMSNVAEIYPLLPEKIAAWIFGNEWEGKVLPAKFGDSSGVRGAARLK